MKTAGTSPTARVLSLVVIVALVAGGLVACWSEHPCHLMPVLLVLCRTTSVVALLTRLNVHLGAMLLLTERLTVALLPYAIVLGRVMRERQYAGWLSGPGIVPWVLWGPTWRRTSRTAKRPVEPHKLREFAYSSVTASSAMA